MVVTQQYRVWPLGLEQVLYCAMAYILQTELLH